MIWIVYFIHHLYQINSLIILYFINLFIYHYLLISLTILHISHYLKHIFVIYLFSFIILNLYNTIIKLNIRYYLDFLKIILCHRLTKNI